MQPMSFSAMPIPSSMSFIAALCWVQAHAPIRRPSRHPSQSRDQPSRRNAGRPHGRSLELGAIGEEPHGITCIHGSAAMPESSLARIVAARSIVPSDHCNGLDEIRDYDSADEVGTLVFLLGGRHELWRPGRSK
jgi:hypothetical protein